MEGNRKVNGKSKEQKTSKESKVMNAANNDNEKLMAMFAECLDRLGTLEKRMVELQGTDPEDIDEGPVEQGIEDDQNTAHFSDIHCTAMQDASIMTMRVGKESGVRFLIDGTSFWVELDTPAGAKAWFPLKSNGTVAVDRATAKLNEALLEDIILHTEAYGAPECRCKASEPRAAHKWQAVSVDDLPDVFRILLG